MLCEINRDILLRERLETVSEIVLGFNTDTEFNIYLSDRGFVVSHSGNRRSSWCFGPPCRSDTDSGGTCIYYNKDAYNDLSYPRSWQIALSYSTLMSDEYSYCVNEYTVQELNNVILLTLSQQKGTPTRLLTEEEYRRARTKIFEVIQQPEYQLHNISSVMAFIIRTGRFPFEPTFLNELYGSKVKWLN